MKKLLITAFLLAILIPVAGTQAENAPPGQLIPPASTEQRMLLPAYTGCGGVPGVPSSNTAYEQEVIERVNTIRANSSLPPLKRVSALDDAARYHATDMGQDNYFSHDSYDRSGGSLVKTCDWVARIQSYYPNWSSLAENIAAGYATPESVMDAWMNSSGHRANILSTSNREIGVGYYQGSGDYYRYWVQDFGRRSDVYPLVINQEAAETDSHEVSLYVYGEGWATQMRFRNEGGVWTEWETYNPNKSWTLTCGVGTKTVYAEIRNGEQTKSAWDTIQLTTEEHHLAVQTNRVAFLYSIETGEMIPASSKNILVEDIGQESGGLDWKGTQTGSWFTASPDSGTTPTTMTITPDNFSTGETGAYTGSITLIATDPADACGSPQTISVHLTVAERVSQAFLPQVTRGQ